MIYYLYHSREPLSYYGLRVDNVKDSALEGVFLSLVVVMIFSVILYWFGYKLNVTVSSVFSYFFFPSVGVSFLYFVHSFLQEFLARGVMQTGLYELFPLGSPRKRRVFAIMLASFAFAITHLPFGLYAIIATFLAGIVFGYVYLKHQNLVGVSIFHFITGKCFFMLLMAMGVHSSM